MVKKRLLVSLGIAATALAASATAWAVVPRGSESTITTCFARDGYLRVIDATAGKKCRKSESELSWSAAGGGAGSKFNVLDGADNVLGELVMAGPLVAIVRRADGSIVGYELGLYMDGPRGHVWRFGQLIYHSADCSGTPFLVGDATTGDALVAAFGGIGVEVDNSLTPIAAWRATGAAYTPTEAEPFLSRKDSLGTCMPESEPRFGARWAAYVLAGVTPIPPDAVQPLRFVPPSS